MKTPLCAIKPAGIMASLAIATLMFALPGYAQNNEEIMRSSVNVPYVSGGIGLDSVDRMDAMSRQFNVKLVFALKSGEYLSDVRVIITDNAGNAVVDTISNGPWFLTTLPRGRFQVTASYAGNAEKRIVAVGATRLNTLDFRWPTE